MKLATSLLGLFLLVGTAKAEVKLPKLLGNGMVLQREKSIKIWGWADVGENVSITFKNKTFRTKANSNKEWIINLPAQAAGGPYHMQINQLELKDILIGDVWLCAGQSNMEALMSRANIKATYATLLPTVNDPQIRQFTVKRDMAFNSITDVTSDKGWVAANSTTVLDFSAVAYFFAKELYQQYKVPIGIINSSVGGTPIQSWVDSETIKDFPAYHELAQRLKDTAEVASLLKAHQLKTASWYKSIKEEDLGVNEKWFAQMDQHDINWEEISSLSQFNKQVKLPKYGSMWFKTTINVPQHLAGKVGLLSLGMMHTEDETYLNGQKVGSINSGYTNRNYSINAGVLKAGENTLTIRLTSPTTGIGFDPKNNYQLRIDTHSIVLDRPWRFKFGIEKELLPRGNGLSLHSPTAYYYAMIKPLANYNIKGIAWYQGESNVSKPEEYESLLTSLITLWRKDWQQPSLPFLYVQLANYSSSGIEPAISNWALLREAQLKALRIPHTAMVVTHDVGERDDIHPANKLAVGKRLALAARQVAYHEKITYSGPIYQSIEVVDKRVYVSFRHTGTGLTVKGKQLHSFSISADGKKFVPAEAKIVGTQVVVWHHAIHKPVAIRYAWADSPDGANLYNKEGLPASSFQSN